MIIPRLTHITFPVNDIEKSVNFYKKWFKLEVHLVRRPRGNTVWMTTPEQNQKK